MGNQIWPAIILSLFVLIGNPLIVMAILGVMGYRKRTGFLAGLTVAQISEFSLIFMAMGITIGHVNDDALGLVTLVGLVTIATSVYMITFSHRLYDLAEPFLGMFERKVAFREDAEDDMDADGYDVVVFGLGRYGRNMGTALIDRGYRVLGVDFDPDALTDWRAMGHAGRFGDATDAEFAAHLPLAGVKVVVSAVARLRGPLTETDAQMALLHGLRSAGYVGDVAVTVNHARDAVIYRQQGATIVLAPFDDASSYAVDLLSEGPLASKG